MSTEVLNNLFLDALDSSRNDIDLLVTEYLRARLAEHGDGPALLLDKASLTKAESEVKLRLFIYGPDKIRHHIHEKKWGAQELATSNGSVTMMLEAQLYLAIEDFLRPEGGS